jgi:Cu-Zn family superoxide dismutase
MAYKLPSLPLDCSALKPTIDAQATHSGTHVNNPSAAVERNPELFEKSADELLRNLSTIPEDVRPAVRHNDGEHVNHTRFGKIIAVPLCVLAFSLAVAAKTVIHLIDAQGNSVGTVVLWDHAVGGGVGLKLNLENLSPGEHALHFHQNAKCDPPDFKSAGPHFNPDGKKHGLENLEGHHAGDMFNFNVGADGKAKLSLTNKDVTLGDDSHSLFSNGGTAIVIHAKADDMKTDPAGNSGDRIACGMITK